MIKAVTVRFSCALAISMLALPAAALPQWDARIARIDEYATAAAELGFSGSVLVARGGEVLLSRGYGQADRDHDVAITPDTVFDIGSITKDFTRAAILLLSDRGSLSLSDTLDRFFPDAPADKAGITLEQVLRHSAGLSEYHDSAGDFEPMTRDEAIAIILGRRLRFEPGTDTAYSNSGYTLLAAVIETVSGQSYAEFLHDQLFEPAGMARTSFYGDQRWAPDEVARGYEGMPGPGGSRSPRDWPEVSWVLTGAGGMVTSTNDLLAWLVASNRGEIIAPATLDGFFGEAVGTGLVRRNFFFAGGGGYGFIGAIVGNAEDDTLTIALGNTVGRYNAERVVDQLAKILAGAEPTPLDALQARDNGQQPPAAGNWGLPDSETGRALTAFLDMIAAGTEDAARTFVNEWFTDEFRAAYTVEAHVGLLRQVQSLLVNPEVESVNKTGQWTAKMTMTSEATGETLPVEIELEGSPPHRIASLGIGG